jgi:hypothetical protein
MAQREGMNMLESIQNTYSILKAVQLFPEVMLAALAAYFIVRQRYDNAKWAVWLPVSISFIGQASFAWPKSTQDAFMCFTMGWVQAGIAIGAYSFLDKYGITDRLGKIVQKKIDEKGGGDAAH